MKTVFASLALVGVLSLPACTSTQTASVQTVEYKTVASAVEGVNLALSLYEAEFEAHQTTAAQDQSVTDLHRHFQSAVAAVAAANIALNDTLAAIAAGKAAPADPATLQAAVAQATTSAIAAGTDLVNLINSFKK